MPSWFTKLFKADDEPAAPSPRSAPRPPILFDEPQESLRRVVEPTVLTDEEPSAEPAEGVRIKAKVEADCTTCVFMVDRPVIDGISAFFESPGDAERSALARSIFALEGVDSVLVHGMNVTVSRDPMSDAPWEPWVKAMGARIRSHIDSGEPAVTDAYLALVPSEDEIRSRLQTVLDTVVNPGIAAHSGAIELDRVEGNTVYIRMLGGCQGCAASTVTLRQGVHQAFRDAVPGLGAILDQTDHAAGVNPFYRQLPAGT